jgi:hypothetical protein
MPIGRILFEPFDRELLIAGNYIGTSTFVNRRSMVDRFAGFDEALRTLEDWESDSEIYGLCARLSPSDPCTNDLSVIEPKDAAIEEYVTNGAVPASLRQLSSLGLQNSM